MSNPTYRKRLGALSIVLVAAACGPSYDRTAPKIVDDPRVGPVRDTTATIAWTTDELSNSLVEYGPTTSYGTVEIETHYLKSHVVTIHNLTPQTSYHLRVESYDVFGNGPARSTDVTITTLPPQPPPDVQITEVMYNPVSATTGEFVELFNNGFDDVDLVGFTFTDGDSTDSLQAFQASGTVVTPGSYALILDPDYAGGYTIPAGTVLVTTGDTTLGNGLASDDPVTLFPPGESTAISTYGTPLDDTDNVPVTTAPTGFSVERRDVNAPDGDGNWCISVDPSGSTPGAANSGC